MEREELRQDWGQKMLSRGSMGIQNMFEGIGPDVLTSRGHFQSRRRNQNASLEVHGVLVLGLGLGVDECDGEGLGGGGGVGDELALDILPGVS